MTTLSEIERAYEAKYSHDQETNFKVVMRRNKLVGLWAADLMGITDGDAEAYAREVIESDFEAPGHDDVVQKVFKDLTAKGVDTSEHIVLRTMDELLVKAKEQILAE